MEAAWLLEFVYSDTVAVLYFENSGETVLTCCCACIKMTQC